MMKPLPISLHAAHKRNLRTQFAALCWRVVKDKPEILLITSRGTRRWIVPKGWPMDGRTPAQCAAQEAWEEAGVRGRASDTCLGVFSYIKTAEDADQDDLPCLAMLYPLKVRSLARDYPEADERRRRWHSPKKAAQRVAEPDLAHILRAFDPGLLR